MKSLKILQQPALAAVVLWVLLIHDSNSAMAASGGRMGGKAFSSPSSSSSSNSKITSYSTPRRPALVDYAEIDYYSMRRQQPCCIHRNDIHASSSSIPSHSWTRDEYIVGIAALFAAMICFGVFIYEADRTKNKTSVLMLQVGLLDSDISLQKELNEIADVADTSTKQGLSCLLTETTLALLRHPDYCISAYSSVDVKRSMEEGESRFSRLSVEERGKFDEETLVNVNNIKRKKSMSQRGDGFSNEYMVVTILVAAEGVYKLPTVNGRGDLKEALQNLASILSKTTLAVEVLWTPQNENDTLSEQQYLEDYPLLRPL
ncbi:FLUCTUATING-LIGHT-ACCLIMATION protein 1, chloroplastic-like [Nicotiana tabacum]|uniref:FLUCTUATING-LIGHT-ACCLIMATION protein 1, chloroplastic-like n=2 Tax=Nicotiana TaxID=4085 RepID=A0A1S4DC27_TOBAC|nr:PREDICTED: uncharacterized protein LOC107828193 [Nicotiana tabacum]